MIAGYMDIAARHALGARLFEKIRGRDFAFANGAGGNLRGHLRRQFSQ